MNSTTAFVTIRQGSKSIYYKNIKEFCGKPLCYWVLTELQKSKVNTIYLLTDSFKFAHIVRNFNLSKVKIELVPEMSDTSMTDDVIHKFVKDRRILYSLDENLLIAQVTSPLTKYTDFNAGLDLINNTMYNSVISVTQNMRHLWNKDTGEPINHPKDKRLRRQDYKYSVIENGSFYITKFSEFMKTKYRMNGYIGFHIMEDYTSVEIDNEVDWQFCEYLYKTYIAKPFLRTKSIKLFAMDIDGVLTDGGLYLDKNGKETKKFSVKDGHGLQLLKERGIKVAVITSNKSNIHRFRFLKKRIKVDYLIEDDYNKFQTLKNICQLENISLDQTAFVGDDVIDKDCLENSGLSFCPKDANPQILKLPNIVILSSKGGDGCVREAIDLVIQDK